MPWDHLSELGPAALCSLFVLAIMFGWLVPGRDRDYWRKAFFEEQRQRQEMQVTGQIVRTAVTALPPAPEDLS